MRLRLLIGFVLLGFGLWDSAAAGSATLAADVRAEDNGGCQFDAFAPIGAISGVEYYSDELNSIVDQVRFRQSRAAVRELYRYESELERLASAYAEDQRNVSEAHCVLKLLDYWASSGALLGESNQQGRYHVKWVSVAMSLAFLRTRASLDRSVADASAIREWLYLLGSRAANEYRGSTKYDNHFFWAKAAGALSSIAAADVSALNENVESGRAGFVEAESEGELRYEATRGGRACRYHSFALSAVLLIEEAADANGIPPNVEVAGAIRRVASRIVEECADELGFDGRRTLRGGLEQAPTQCCGWVEGVHRRTGWRVLNNHTESQRPINVRHVGNTTAYFSVEAVASYGLAWMAIN